MRREHDIASQYMIERLAFHDILLNQECKSRHLIFVVNVKQNRVGIVQPRFFQFSVYLIWQKTPKWFFFQSYIVIKMRAIQILMSIAAILALTSSAATGENFGDFLENLDVEKLMNDEASWKTVYECIMDKAPCGDYKELRGKIIILFLLDMFELEEWYIIVKDRNRYY